VLGDNFLKLIEDVPFLNARVPREIEDMRCDIDRETFKRFKAVGVQLFKVMYQSTS
jgi:hypothetical protein